MTLRFHSVSSPFIFYTSVTDDLINYLNLDSFQVQIPAEYGLPADSADNELTNIFPNSIKGDSFDGDDLNNNFETVMENIDG